MRTRRSIPLALWLAIGIAALVLPATASLAGLPFADLGITKTDAQDPVFVGNNAVYTLAVHNFGPADAPATSVTDTLPADITYVGSVPSQGGPCTESAGTVTCPLGTIANGGNASVEVTVTTTKTGTITDTASVTARANDNNPDDNSDSQSTDVVAPLGLHVFGHGHKDTNANNQVDQDADIHIGSLDVTGDGEGSASGLAGMRDGRKDPPGPPTFRFKCEFIVQTLTQVGPTAVEITGGIKRCDKGAGPVVSFDMVINDHGPNPPHADGFSIKLFDGSHNLIYSVGGQTTVGLGDLTVETPAP